MQKVALVTGSSSELGLLIIRKLTKEGYKVYGTSRKKPDTKKFFEFYKLDITSDQEIKKIVKKIISTEKKIDVVVNVAGITFSGHFANYTAKDFLTILDTNVVGAFRIIKEVVPYMKKQGGGKIINITSLNGLVSLPYFSLYSASKHALQAFGEAISYELSANNIFVTNISPGAIDFGLKNKLNHKHKPLREKFKILYFLFPFVKAQEIAEKVLLISKTKTPPKQIIIGRDALMISQVKRFVPNFVWVVLMNYLWRKK